MAEKAPQTSLHTVLVVENDVLVRLSISAYLRDCGYRTIEAASDDEAMIVLTSSQLVIDVVLGEQCHNVHAVDQEMATARTGGDHFLLRQIWTALK